ncbi:hypothetical protein DUI87_16096 [Hirundo rustica rustica]|uniref:Uncharacterized protein n=1 Tax=Hirundo rustica rustica TaxID=333673 RepID=A0A3M0K107_HIRRU|nr:hypothetical protein DUI87_16096 [Hirundo rustica rustica]
MQLCSFVLEAAQTYSHDPEPNTVTLSPEEKQPWTKLINSDVLPYEHSGTVYRSTDVMLNATGAKYHTVLPQGEMGDEQGPPEPCLGTGALQCLHQRQRQWNRERTHSKFADGMKLSGAGDTTEGQDAM